MGEVRKTHGEADKNTADGAGDPKEGVESESEEGAGSGQHDAKRSEDPGRNAELVITSRGLPHAVFKLQEELPAAFVFLRRELGTQLFEMP